MHSLAKNRSLKLICRANSSVAESGYVQKTKARRSGVERGEIYNIYIPVPFPSFCSLTSSLFATGFKNFNR